MSYLNELNDIQRQAVEQIDGPVMIIAGPGSGKTRVLTYRIAHLIKCGIDPFNILSLTFTNKASREMRHRIEGIVGTEARNLWMGTFHSVFARVLRVDAEKIGYPSNFTIYDTQDTKSLIKSIVKEKNLNPDLYKPNTVYNRISAAKNRLLSPQEYLGNVHIMADDAAAGRPKIGELYYTYADRCFKAGAMDFDDLLYKMHELITRFPESLMKFQHMFQYVMVDEFQDTNFVQYEIVKKIAELHQNICVVGDDAQSIYAFRGATIQNILNFERDYPSRNVFKLEQNYRSTKNIVKIANEIIAQNKNQLDKTIWTDNDTGNKITLTRYASDNEEGKKVADSIHEEGLRNHFHNRDFAVLYRTNAQSRAFEEALRRNNIPYVVYGGLSFYQRKEIKDLIAYLKLTVNHFDEEALKRVVNYPTRGIGKTSLEKVMIFANDNNLRMWEALEKINETGLSARAKNAISNFVVMIKSFATMLEKKNAYEVTQHIAKQSGILTMLHNDKSVEGLSRFENLQELLNSIKEFDESDEESSIMIDTEDKSLGSYLQQVALLTDKDNSTEKENSVKLMTMHAAKGLEFPVVYVVGLEEELFPSRMSINTREEIEEERRLFYVATTRAEKKLYLSYAMMRYRFGNLNYCEPSRFLQEINSENFEIKGGGSLSKSRSRFSGGSAPSSGRSTFRARQEKSAPSGSGSNKTTFKRPTPTVNHTPSTNFRQDDVSNIKVGQKVEHQRFGIGKVVAIEGEGANKITTIDFEGLGSKRILLRFAKLMLLD